MKFGQISFLFWNDLYRDLNYQWQRPPNQNKIRHNVSEAKARGQTHCNSVSLQSLMDPFPLPLLLASDKPQTRNYSNPIFAALPFGDPCWKSFPRSCAVLLLAKLNGIEIQLFVLSNQRSGCWPILSTEKVTTAWIYFGRDIFSS